jgi:hypothetical protein
MSDQHSQERQNHAKFACHWAEPEFRAPLAAMYECWVNANQTYFDGQLLEPHMEFGRTAPASIGHCERHTGYGGRLLMTFNRGLMTTTDKDNKPVPANLNWLRNPWPASGVNKFLNDLVLRFTIRQFVLEVKDSDEAGYRGYGPLFQREANRIGISLGLPQVSVRRRGHDDEDPPCIGWPHCVRPISYYEDDITEELYVLAAGITSDRRSARVHNVGILELVQYLLVHDRADDAQTLIARHLNWLNRYRTRRLPVRRRVEDGKENLDGSPLGTVTFNPEWLQWNKGTVSKIAYAIKADRSYGDLPILGDALEEAGCYDPRILQHLRADITHDSRCWVLRMLAVVE